MKSRHNNRPKVLLLEEAHRSTRVVEVLARADFEVIQVQDTTEALATLEAREDVDVLVADIDMPCAMNGVALGRYVQDRWPGLGLVLTSNQVRHLRPDEVPGKGCFLPQPIPEHTLLEEIRLAVRHP